MRVFAFALLCVSLFANVQLVRVVIRQHQHIKTFAGLMEGMRNIENLHHP